MKSTSTCFLTCASNERKLLQVVLNILIFMALCADIVSGNAVKETILKIPALGRISHLGSLYDARTDSFNTLSIFNSNPPTPLITTTESPRINTESKIISTESDKFKLFGVDLDTAAIIQMGILQPEGAASVLKEDVTSTKGVTGIFLQTFQTAEQTLPIFHDELRNYFNIDAKLYSSATHIVTGISWGGSIAVTFTDTSSGKQSSFQRSKLLKQEFSKLKRMSGNISKRDSSFEMHLTADVTLQNLLPTTLLEVCEQINHVEDSIKLINSGIGVPIKFTLTPISVLKKYLNLTTVTTEKIAHKIDQRILSKYLNVFDDIRKMEQTLIKIEENSNCVSNKLHQDMEQLLSNFNEAERSFKVEFKKVTLGVKSAAVNNSALITALENYERQNFNPKNVRNTLNRNAQGLQKVNFCSQLKDEYPDIEYFGSAPNLISNIYQNHNKPTYVLFTKSEFKENDRVMYEDNLNIFLNLLYKPSNALFIVDCDFSYAQCDSINGTVIKQIRQGNYTFDDVRLEIKITEMENKTEFVNCHKKSGVTGALCVSIVENKSAKLKNQNLNTSHKKPEDSRLHKVVGGTAAAPNEFPFQVLFLINATGVHCGGTILDENFILTAAHCLHDNDEEYKTWTIVAGDHSWQIDEGTEQRRQIRDVQIHEKYIPIAEINDIAIVKLDHPLNLSAAVQPILLPDADYEATGDAVVTGWGKVRYLGIGNPLVLQKATVPIVDREDCVEAYAKPQVFVSVKMLCAGDVVQGGVDACQGDSGGPLSVKLNGSNVLIGVVSGGIGCGSAEYPGIYMQVSKYVDWINDTLNNFGNCSLHNDCLNGGKCVDGLKSHSCICADGYEGQYCAAVINNCAPSNPCLNGGACATGIKSYTCTCADRFTGINCQDVNECRYPGTCKSPSALGNCRRCGYGFVKDSEDDTRCKYANSNASLIVSSYEDIRMISLNLQNTTQMLHNDDHVLGTDYNFGTSTIFWFSWKDNKIYRAPIHEESAKQNIFYDSSSLIRGVAVDWIYHHLYWVDAGRGQICVSNFNSTIKKVLINKGLSSLRSIAVNPLNGWMYWSDRGRIERAGLDGSHREVFLSTNNEDPLGLVVDFVDSRLYWSQGDSLSSIWSCEFDGSVPKLIFTPTTTQFAVSFFYKVGTFDKYVYFSEMKSNTIYRVNKCDGNELKMIHKSESGLWDFKIYDATLQPKSENLCSKRIGQCSHFCFPVPSSGKGSVSTTMCGCPDGISLSADKQNCV